MARRRKDGLRPGTWAWLEALADYEVHEVLASLPRHVRERVDAVPIVLQRRPGADLVRDGVAPDLLGLFTGTAFPEGAVSVDALPPSILLFLENIDGEAGGDADAYREEVRRTLLHEIGHFLGLDESGLEERDLD
jgi:predicted Zn-dependent protease with MMP-like domain